MMMRTKPETKMEHARPGRGLLRRPVCCGNTAGNQLPLRFRTVRMHAPTAAFTLMEVMIAIGILFTCLFAVLALTSNALGTARKLQQHKAIDTGTIAGMIYVALANTNRLDEGPIDIKWEDVLPPGYKCEADLTSIGTNGLGEIDFLVEHNGSLEMTNIFWMYLPGLKVAGISSSLPQH